MPSSPPESPEPFSSAVLLHGNPSADLLRLQIERIAPHFRVALLTGEPGTGKLTVAHHLHRLGPVAGGSFTCCRAEAFACADSGQSAHRTPGTLYLHGIDQVPIDRQAALLERLDSLARHLRIVVASEADLRGLVVSGRIQQSLYERVGALAIRLTPLRERRDSIAPLAAAMLASLNPAARFSDLALVRLRQHGWRANLRELWQSVQQAAAWHEDSSPQALQGETPYLEIPAAALQLEPAPDPGPPALRLEEVIERHVLTVVERCAGNKLRAAELLGISRSTLYRMLDAAVHNG